MVPAPQLGPPKLVKLHPAIHPQPAPDTPIEPEGHWANELNEHARKRSVIPVSFCSVVVVCFMLPEKSKVIQLEQDKFRFGI